MTGSTPHTWRTRASTAVATVLVLAAGLSLAFADDAPDLELSLRVSRVDEDQARTLARQLRAAMRGSDARGVVRVVLRHREQVQRPAVTIKPEVAPPQKTGELPVAEPAAGREQVQERMGKRTRRRSKTAEGRRTRRQGTPAADIGRRLRDDAARLSTSRPEQAQHRAGQAQAAGKQVRRGADQAKAADGSRLHALPPQQGGRDGNGDRRRPTHRKGLRGKTPGQGTGPGAAGAGGTGPGPQRR